MYGLVFGGGGAKGAYQIGVWKAINELGIEVGYVCGTSVGALNGAFFVQKQFDLAYNMWSKLEMDQVFNGDEETFKGFEKIAEEGLFAATFQFLKHTTKKIWEDKGLDITPLRELIDKNLDEDRLRNSDIGFGFVTLSVNDRRALRLNVEDIEQGELKYYLLGSAMIPGFTQDENFDKKFIDGGLYDNFPLKMAYEKGYKKIIGVNLFTNKIKPKYKDAEVIGIGPSKNLGNILYFNKDNAVENIRLGYLDALRAFGELQGFNYFIKNIPSEKEISKVINELPYEDKNTITKLLFRKDLVNDKVFYEKVLYKLGKELEMPSNGSYQDLVVYGLEKLLKKQNFDEFEIYDFKQAIKDLREVKINKVNLSSMIILDALL